jgi:hypothetical protein
MEVPAIIWRLDTLVAVHYLLVVKTALKVCNVLVGMHGRSGNFLKFSVTY